MSVEETSMSFADTVILGAIAGFTIFLGLPIARLRNPRPAWQAFGNDIERFCRGVKPAARGATEPSMGPESVT